MKNINIEAGIIMISACMLIGAAVQYFTGFYLLTATLLIMALVMINGLVVFNEDLDKDGFDYQEGVTDTVEAKIEQRNTNTIQIIIIIFIFAGALWSHI